MIYILSNLLVFLMVSLAFPPSHIFEHFRDWEPRKMKKCSCCRVWTKFLTILLLVSSTMIEGLQLAPDVATGVHRRGSISQDRHHTISNSKEGVINNDLSMQSYGSSLPECSHACGPCFPCKKVMVSFEDLVAESCPIVYRCMFRGRYYDVPSN